MRPSQLAWPKWSIGLLFALVGCCGQIGSSLGQESSSAIDLNMAEQYFAEARALSEKDSGQMWGISLAGPMMFVDPATRQVVANHADAEAQLLQTGAVYIGQLPPEVMIANTALKWSGTNWTMLLWPLPQDQTERAILLAHEAWHRMQQPLGFEMSSATNVHLDTVAGRYWLQLEWRALERALQDPEPNQQAIHDVLIFRNHRRALFSDHDNAAARQENSMELHEGLAEYTGLVIGAPPAQRVPRTLEKLKYQPAKLSTFVRSFAYLSGPAYGLLLHRYDPGWHRRLSSGDDLGVILGKANDIQLEAELEQLAATRADEYDGPDLWAAEKGRDEANQRLLAGYRRQLIDGPRLVIPLQNMQMSFDPSTLVPLGAHGTVYPTIEISDQWGVLRVTGGALIAADFRSIVVAVPSDFEIDSRSTDGWEITLDESWRIMKTTTGFEVGENK